MSASERSSAGTRTAVLIVGAGPVGCVLALELARHDVPCTVVERSATPSPVPKMDYINGRSMELLRRLGIAEEIRERGVDPGLASNFVWTRGLDEPPIAVWEYASPAELMKRAAEVNDGSAPLEAYQRMQGSLLEEIVRRHVREHPLIDLREGWSCTGLRQDDDGVEVDVVEAATGTPASVRASYVAACDGAGSTVRRRLGIPADPLGRETVHCSVYFTSHDPALRRFGRAFVTNAARGVNLVSRDEEDTWTASFVIPGDGPEPQDPIAAIGERLGVELAVDEVRNVSRWRGALAVARAYRQGRVFLAGDSAHHFYPVGGHGANTGIADATDLGWKLAARVRGWGGPALLDAYEAERRPVALFTREMCGNLLEVYQRFRRLVQLGATRRQLEGFLAEETYQLDNVGIHFGYRYASSPVVCHEDGGEPDWRWDRITPSTWPGLRAPSVRLADGGLLFDRLGRGFTLVDLSGRAAGAALAEEAARRAVPLAHLRIDDADVRACWERALVLLRPDQHVAWRGDRVPADPGALLDRVCGVQAGAAGPYTAA